MSEFKWASKWDAAISARLKAAKGLLYIEEDEARVTTLPEEMDDLCKAWLKYREGTCDK